MMYRKRKVAFTFNILLVCLFILSSGITIVNVRGSPVNWRESIIKDASAYVIYSGNGDVDNDGYIEVVMGLFDNSYYVSAFQFENNQWIEDRITNAPANHPAISIGDADNDGKNEVVIIGEEYSSMLLYKKVNNVWNKEIIQNFSVWPRAISIGDADNDGRNEIVVGLSDTTNEVRLYKKNSNAWRETNITDVPNSIYSLAIGDANNDNKNEIVLGAGDTIVSLRMYQYLAGSWIENNVTYIPTSIIKSIVISDVDNDNKNEIIVGSTSVRSYKNIDNSWFEFIIYNGAVESIAVGDVDYDNKNEVITGLSGPSSIRLFKLLGNSWNGEIVRDILPCWSVSIGDLNNDSKNEIYAGTSPGLRTYSYIPPTVPTPPQGLTASAVLESDGRQYVELRWSGSLNDGGTAITNYSLYRGTTPNGETLLYTFHFEFFYKDYAIIPGQTYYYKVSANNSVGESSLSSETVVNVPPVSPSPPLNVTGTSNGLQAHITWSPPSSDGGSPVIKYKIYRGLKTGLSDNFTILGNVLNYTDTILTYNGTYYYKISALNTIGEGTPSGEISVSFSLLTNDSDTDSLPDDWEMLNFNSLNYSGADDSDGDGYTNIQEYQNNTNPRSSSSVPGTTTSYTPSFIEKNLWLIIVIVIILACVVIAGYFMVRKRKS
ncbi:MAG: VCBS repeat-containing protein [Euryarchaeota archaeon]|nr:VCBS repeat-containing protein [Euryarchaeota archaeon]